MIDDAQRMIDHEVEYPAFIYLPECDGNWKQQSLDI
jgi:hypothetical protein